MNAATIADRRLHPLTVILRFVKNLPSTLLGLPALFTVMSNVGWGSFLTVMGVSVTVFTLWHWMMWRRFKYGIGPSEVVIESGLLDRSRRTIPFDRIQDVDFERGPLQRIFGLAKVRLETGGAGKDEGLLDSLGMNEAEMLRQAVRAGQGQRASDTPGAEPIADDAAIFAMSPRRVVISGLFNFSLLWIAGIFAVLNQLGDVLPFDPYVALKSSGWGRSVVAETLTVSAAILLLFFAILLGLASGVISTLLRDFGFRLSAEVNGFRRERGLLTRTEVVIPKRRIQLALIQSGPLRRHFDWWALRIQTLGSGEKKGEGGLQDAAPLARIDEIDGILGKTRGLRRPDPAILVRVSRSHVWKAMIGGAAAPIIPVIAATIFLPILALTALTIPLFVGIAIIERRWHRYAFEDGLLFIQTGWWRRKLWIMPVTSAQTVTLSRSWLQRKLDIATLRFDTAGASMFGSPAISDMRTALAETLMAAILERNRHQSV